MVEKKDALLSSLQTSLGQQVGHWGKQATSLVDPWPEGHYVCSYSYNSYQGRQQGDTTGAGHTGWCARGGLTHWRD